MEKAQEEGADSSVVIVNIRLPFELADWIDTLIARGLYKNRSEVIREFSRRYVLRNRA